MWALGADVSANSGQGGTTERAERQKKVRQQPLVSARRWGGEVPFFCEGIDSALFFFFSSRVCRLDASSCSIV